MRITILILSILLAAVSLQAQRIQHLKKGNNFYEEQKYAEAVNEYEILWNSATGSKLLGVDAKMNLANSYRIMDQPYKAEKLYSQVMNYAEDRLSIYLEYGKVLMSLGRYDEAVKQFQMYAQKDETSTEPAKLIQQCKDIENIEALFSNVEVSQQETVNDSATRQLGITYYGDAVVFASDEAGEELGNLRTKSYLNMRISGLDAQGNLKRSDKFSHSLNDLDRHDGPAAFTRDGIQIFYSRSVANREGGSVLQIWSAYFKEGQWTEPKPMPFMTQGKNFTHPSISADGRTLYFSSDMKGSFGGLDIWESTYEDGRWTYPKNLGKDINTAQDDAWPYIHPDGDLYFSSKGHPGFGGYDVFRTRPLGNGVDWLPIENLGKPFNSSFSEISFIMSDDQTQGFFASNRNKSYDMFRYVLVGAEKQSLPAEIGPRISIGISEFAPAVELVEDLPPKSPDMTDEQYVEYLEELAATGQIELPTPEKGTETGNPTTDNPTAGTSTNPESGGNPSETGDSTNYFDQEEETKVDENIVLAVVLKVTDIANSRALGNAVVLVRNSFTQDEVAAEVNEKGEVEVRLDPDQKYLLIGRCEGYKETSLPVSTMNVTSSDRVQANLPLERQ